MQELKPVFSPIFPTDKDIDAPSNAPPLAQTGSIKVFIQLAEPVIFLQGFEPSEWENNPPRLLRGSLIIRVLKPNKIKKINLNFKGYTRTEWPEGIPPKKDEYTEIHDIVNHTWPFYNAETDTYTINTSNNNRNEYLLNGSKASMYIAPENIKHNNNNNNNNNMNASSSTRRRSSVISNFSLSSSPNTKGVDNLIDDDIHTNNNIDMFSLDNTTSSNPQINPIKSSPIKNNNTHHQHSNKSSFISDLFNGTPKLTLSSNDTQQYTTNSNNNNTNNNNNTKISSSSILSNETFIFEPGDYIYTFEYPIPDSFPESLKSTFGFVNYQLIANIERYGVFKSNISARHNVKLVRTPSNNSVEETEPIAISKDWKDQLHYDIVVASKDIILDAFLPIAFNLSPLDKVTLHRIRIYLTESMDYYCRNKKVHRMEPTRKYLLAEHNGPLIDQGKLSPNNLKTPKAKFLGNLLKDEKSGDLINKEFEYQIFIPTILQNNEKLHPDTGFENIKSNHWINLCLRLSHIIDGKRRHFEVNIDSPIHVLNKLCSHANTLLPSYVSFNQQQLLNEQDHINNNKTNNNKSSDSQQFGNVPDINLYHPSNIFFPSDVFTSPAPVPTLPSDSLNPVKSPGVQSMDVKFPINGFLSPRLSQRKSISNSTNYDIQKINKTTKNNKNNKNTEMIAVLNSPKLTANIYQPESLKRELTSPQALPMLSPLSSPRMKHIPTLAIPPPLTSLDSSSSQYTMNMNMNINSNPNINTNINSFDKKLPTYEEVMKMKNTNNSATTTTTTTTTPSSILSFTIPQLELNNSIETLDKSTIQSHRSSLSSQRFPLQQQQQQQQQQQHYRRQTNTSLHSYSSSSKMMKNQQQQQQDDEDGDIASGVKFNFIPKPSSPKIIPSRQLHSPILNSLNLNNYHPADDRSNTSTNTNTNTTASTSISTNNRRNSLQFSLPSTMRNHTEYFNDLSQILSNASGNNTPTHNTKDQDQDQSSTHSSDGMKTSHSSRSSFDASGGSNNRREILRRSSIYSEPLLNTYPNGNKLENDEEEETYQSLDSIANFESSIDITALYDRKQQGWHPLQTPELTSITSSSSLPSATVTPLSGLPKYSLNNIKQQQQITADFKEAIGRGTIERKKNTTSQK
ncbi:Aly1p NDAI_0B05040 [Naumovozyma dairenensis CBS 421]|uniref:Arrestin C-terminal-like domain-containing protein n=1 Tax=Naumovozyma dairenensis (strain ATCC 10597 / BCRC 20456 / CBS 421 / NBRC 0211 / NRRL Y-12639) TaxID=1071378 RepID=G0W6X6_NAUDC|nr:hypothetical protein NDAI_0B05040 [Naumovozyma dairenensis CBS 421]CCD23537.1 hypothetical protein NDAI_0B05040 [Naumovozyma dairenensis CBS 421]